MTKLLEVARRCSSPAGEGGRIIAIGSVDADRVPLPGGGVYAMTEAAVVGLTRGLARDLGPRGTTGQHGAARYQARSRRHD